MSSMLGLGLTLTMFQGGGGVPAPATSIAVTNQVSPSTSWALTALADLALIDAQPGDYIEIEGAPAGFAIVGGA